MTKYSLEDIESARDMVEKFAPIGSRIAGVVVDVNKMGDKRRIRFFVATVDKHSNAPKIVELTGYFATLLGLKTGTGAKGYGAIVSGGGMDMVFHVISSVSGVVYGDDYALKQN